MTLQTFSILLYTTNEYKDYAYGIDDTCEAVCREVCKDLGITPIANLLFSLRIKGTNNFLPGCKRVLPDIKYEFRLRYQVPTLSELKKMDKMAYNYYFHQVKSDLINDMIPELEYPNHKDKVVGLVVTSMYIEMLEKDLKVNELERNYRNYVPKKYIKKHLFIIKTRILNELKDIKNMNHDSYYVKSTYLESINTLAPNYLVERYTGNVPYLPEDQFVQHGTCPVELEFSPNSIERPGLSVFYSYKKIWKHIAKIEDIYAIILERQDVVKLEIRDCPAGFSVQITDPERMGSFVSALAGFYRLSVKWTIDLSRELTSPQLADLRTLKCHGPIGGAFAYHKLRETQSIPGSYIIRQCEKVYDNYYIDIIKDFQDRLLIQTFKITRKDSMWHLHLLDGTVNRFTSLTELANTISTQSKQKFRIAPSEYDKSPLLLLCMPPHQMTVMQSINEHSEYEMRKRPVQILHPVKDFRTYINSKRTIENGIITQMRAEWLLPKEKKLEVTLKILNSKNHLTEFLNLAAKWSSLESPELIKMYGFTFSSPHTIVIESTKLGPLDEFLQRQSKHAVSMAALIDTAYSLARALHYLQENNIIHGRIRCASLQVVRFEQPNMLSARLGDPGFQQSYSNNDIPWIPYEYHNNLEHARHDFKAEVWAYATTVWEILSRGHPPTYKEFMTYKRRLPKPHECPNEMYEIMLDGWNVVRDKRSTPQMIFARLISAREAHSRSYSTIFPLSMPREDTMTIRSNGSVRSTNTEHTHLTSHGDLSYVNSDTSERVSNDSESSTISDGSINDEHSPLLFYPDLSRTILSDHTEPMPHENKDDFSHTQSIIELDEGGQIIYQGKIGSGNYGIVFRGQLEYESTIKQVAIKQFKTMPDRNSLRDFEREINIMQSLQHPNIVKIITWMHHPSILIIMEYMRHGSFHMYLSVHSPSLTTQRLLKFAKDIASGMEYLVSKQIVHRDLAARNILVGEDECVKISDFGLAQVADVNGYYVIRNSRDLPMKWYAPETLSNNKYSFSSDVWSFGIVNFEMFSHGQEPNLVPGQELTPYELVTRLLNGERLPRPLNCPQNIYDKLMMPCWKGEPKERPHFSRLLQIINELIGEYEENV